MMIKRLVIVVNLLLVLIGGYLIFDLVLAVLKRDYPVAEEGLSLSVLQAAPGGKEEKYPFQRYLVIEKRDIFASRLGIFSVTQPGTKQVREIPLNLPKTSLRLRLKGTIIRGEIAFAIIESLSKKKEEVYKLGDVIEGATIIAIYKKRIVLDRQGRQEVLEILDSDKVIDLRKPLPQKRVAQPAAHPPAVGQIISTGDVQYLKENANELLSQVRISPHFAQGAASGYRISNVAAGSLIGKYGFKEGDVVKSMNGIPLDSPDKVLEAYQAAQSADSVEITVEREGKPVTMTYKIGK